ncbi:MAG: SMC-Scp complex subunit ScpB [Pseudomonadota bacterium]
MQTQQIDDILQENKNEEDHALRIIEALLFASDAPLSVMDVQKHLEDKIDAKFLLRKLQTFYDGRGVVLMENGGKWAFRTAADLGPYLTHHVQETRKLSRSAQEVLGIIAYHQPITRTEIETIRGVGISKGTLDLLIEIGWIKLGKRRETPGRPVTFMTTDHFLDHFGLYSVKDLPGLKELKEAGFLDDAGRDISSEALQTVLDHAEETAASGALSDIEDDISEPL